MKNGEMVKTNQATSKIDFKNKKKKRCDEK
jgi:hypothetical protein